jgi:hypothetical protein
VHIGKTQPIFDVPPKPRAEATIEEEVVNIFWSLLAKQTQSIIWPSSFSECSDVNILFCVANKSKNLTLGGAQAFNTHL